MMPPQQVTSVTLRALDGEPLRNDRICEMVEATARAIAERQGIRVIDLTTDAASITTTLVAGRMEAIGFAAELRRLTTSWYTQKFGAETLWGDPDRDDIASRDGSGGPEAGDDDENWLGDPEAWKQP